MQYLDELVIHLKEEILLEILFVPLDHQAINCNTSGILCSAKRLTFKEVLSGDICSDIKAVSEAGTCWSLAGATFWLL